MASLDKHHFNQMIVTFDNRVISTIKNRITFDSTISLSMNTLKKFAFARSHFSTDETWLKFDLFLSMADAEILKDALVSSRMNNCNALFSGLPHKSTKSLQMFQNAAI